MTNSPAVDQNLPETKAKAPKHADELSQDAEAVPKSEKDDCLTEALEKTFPASDPVASGRFD